MGTKQFVQYQLAPEIYKINKAVEEITASMTGLESNLIEAVNAPRIVKPGDTEKDVLAFTTSDGEIDFSGPGYVGYYEVIKDGVYLFKFSFENVNRAGSIIPMTFSLKAGQTSKVAGSYATGDITTINNVSPFTAFTDVTLFPGSGDIIYYNSSSYLTLPVSTGLNQSVDLLVRLCAGDYFVPQIRAIKATGMKFTVHYRE